MNNKQTQPSRFWLTIALLCSMSVQCISTESEPIRPADSLPETTPWNLKALSRPPEFEWSDGAQIRSLYYKSEPYQGRTTRVFAYYATPGTISGDPSRDRNLPALVLVHGGGGTAFSQWAQLWASRGYAAIAMDLAGCGPKKAKLSDGGPGQGHDAKFATIEKPVTGQWTYHAVANVIRAHSLILSFPEVDPGRSAVTGISWGGYLTCIVAGIDTRFKAAVPVYGCGFLHENSVWLNEFAKMPAESREKWVRLWDPSQYVGSAAMPILFVNGGKDFAYPPDSYAKTYALVRSPKNLHFVPNLPHGHIFNRPKSIEVFIAHHINNGIPLARITSLKQEGNQITALFDAETKQVKAELHYTVDDLPGDPKTRTWVTQPATIEKNKIIANPPPDNVTIWFLTLRDERNTMVSSKLMFPADEEDAHH